ncbi:hypothetical protein ABFA07_017180 [Porites harrisoni]
MADNRKSFAPSMGEVHSTELMREKLERWRRMTGRRSAVVNSSSVYNRSRSAVMLNINGKNKKGKERIIKGSQSSSQLKAQTGYNRIGDQSVGSESLGCPKKRKETFLSQQKKAPLTNHGLESNTTLGDAGTKQYRDKTLSMSERLKLWRTDKRKSSQDKPAEKKRQQLTKVKRKSHSKENTKHYQKLENDTKNYCTPASKKQTNSVVRKTRFVTPSSQRKYGTLQSKGALQSTQKSTVNTMNRKKETTVRTEASTGGCEAESNNMKSYKDKTLDMRERLELWRAEKGKTPKYKTPAFVKNPRSVQELNVHEKKRLSFDCHEESNDARAKQSQAVSPGQGENIEENLRECLKQLEEGECDLEKVAAKLDLYNSACPHTTQIANYWLCRAKIAQKENDFDRVVCLYEQALVFKAQPESLIRDAVCSFVKFMKENGSQEETIDEICGLPASSPTESKTDDKDTSLEELNSSIIKFCLTEATPYRKRFKATFGKSVLTPVRRSVRLERVSTQHPSVLQEHDLTVRKLEELPENVQNNLLYKPNFAVNAELNEAWTELQLDFNQ